MGGRLPKQYLPLSGRSLLEWSIEPFLRCLWIEGVVVVLAVGDRRFAKLDISRHPKILLASGAETRAGSVLSGLEVVASRMGSAKTPTYVLVHDAARPCLRPTDLRRLRDAASDRHGGLLAARAVDTLKQSKAERVTATLNRSALWHAQTPQMFRLDLLQRALQDCLREGIAVTDEASAMEHAGFNPRLVAASAGNLKITYPEDLKLAEFWLSQGQSKA